MKIVGVFYRAFQYAKDPKFLGCAENALGLREFLESKGHTYIVTDDKDGDNCGELKDLLILTEVLKHFRFLDGFCQRSHVYCYRSMTDGDNCREGEVLRTLSEF